MSQSAGVCPALRPAALRSMQAHEFSRYGRLDNCERSRRRVGELSPRPRQHPNDGSANAHYLARRGEAGPAARLEALLVAVAGRRVSARSDAPIERVTTEIVARGRIEPPPRESPRTPKPSRRQSWEPSAIDFRSATHAGGRPRLG